MPPASFWPKPAVDSTLVRVRFRAAPPVEVPDEARLFALIRASFQQRRKTLGTALLPLYERPDDHPALFDLAEMLLAMDEQLLLWRLHHVTMVERMIGNKPGTGGSSGVPYLASTTKHRGFPDLWALRTQLTPGY